MEETLYYNSLYDIYSNLLTEKQRETFEDYFFENLTIEEIAYKNMVSKNAISKQIKIAKKELNKYEECLHILELKKNLENELSQNPEKLSKLLKIISR